jgi:UPF0755 protein
MTRHRRGSTDGDEGDAYGRAGDYERTPQQPEPPHDYFPSPWEDPARGAQRPARGALGTSSSRDGGPGEVTGPPWEMPGWDDSQPIRRVPPQGGLSGGHPSGPLPSVSSGPLPRVPSDSWPGRGGPSDPLAPLPPGAEDWPDSPGGGYAGSDFAGGRSSGSGYPPDPYLDGPGPGYGSPGREDYHGDQDDASYLRTGYPDTGYGGGHEEDQDYARTDSGYLGHGEPATGVGEYGPDDYAGEPGYPGDDFGREDYGRHPGYPGEPGYPPGTGYPPDDGYLPEEGYATDNGYGRDAGYPGQVGYPSEEAGYPGEDEYQGGRGSRLDRGATTGRPRDHDDDRGYGEPGDWYGDVDDDQPWADEDLDEGFVPGLGSDADPRRARVGGPGRDRAQRPGGRDPVLPRGGRPGPGRKGPVRRAAPWIALSVLIVVLATVGGVGYYFYRNYLHPPDYSGPGTGSVVVHILPGETATQVGQLLQQKGVVASVRAFSNAAKASGHGTALEPGYYRVHEHMAAALAFALLLKPSSRVQLTVPIPEGLRLSQIIAVLGQHTGNLRGYQQAIKDTAALGLPSYAKGNPEGYLFPATYTVQPGTPPLTVLKEMVQRYDQEAASVLLGPVLKHDQITAAQAITVASLVQAEGGRTQDFPKIARVIYNRLNAGTPLQLDSTVMYALHTYGILASSAQTKVNSPYNTYLHAGLPPGPIDSPGDAAIRAALHPVHGNWTYFVTVNPRTGLTKFTNSYAQFQIYQAELNAYLAKHH